MRNNFSPLIRNNNPGLGCVINLLLIGLLLASVGLGWIVNGFLIFFLVLLLIPLVAWVSLQWWIGRNLVESECPVCSYEFTGFNKTECRCPNCGENLQVEGGKFLTITPPGTIDVQAVEVTNTDSQLPNG